MSRILVPKTIKAYLGIDKGGYLQKFFVHECARRMDKYVPMDTGMLSRNTFEGENYIDYNQPYAYYQYNGISKSGKELNHSKLKHPLATSHWDVEMWTAEKHEVIKALQDRIGK